ncbi:hypothetical protein JAK58_00765 [Stenotrophomonas maltophilia]|uniref:restriction endonuclease fold toxin 5 domain-containing protein n=1 Tax=Stenotrophomonas maltophilia TaxID=40324 RepID=UPI0021C87AF4|nr:restriction endonuclease fold toxin 5 domain-containing protein [Stenotrophomonas maltophilia]MCU1090041.1 hypothetical protein [Stenotrophomonas maltophilia]
MGAVPFPIPPPPVTSPGAWDPVRDAPVPFPDQMPGNTAGGPTLGQIWQKIKEAAGVETGVKTEPRVQTSETDCSQTSNQNDCNACKLAQGYLVPANYTIPLTQYRDYDYQLRIANRLAGPESFDYTYGGTTLDRARLKLAGRKSRNRITVTEWNHGGIRFDGFWRAQCTVVETKGHYKQFFEDDGELRFWAQLDRTRPTILESWLRQFHRQRAHVLALGRPAKLEWHFLEIECFDIAVRLFKDDSFCCRHSP